MPNFSRVELYELVWKDPVRSIAQGFGVSDVWLKKCCASADIPVPDRGYWAKLRAGKTVIVRKLPPRGPGMSDRIQIGKETFRSSWPVDPERELAEPEPVAPHFDEPMESVAARVAKMVGKVPQRRDLNAAHALIYGVLEEDETRRTKPANAPYRLRWSDPLFDSPFEQRRLRLLNGLMLGFAKAGFKCWLSDENARLTGVVVGGQQISFRLDHPEAKTDREGKSPTRAGKVDTLQFTLQGGKRVWTDTAHSKLESQLTEIVTDTIIAGETQLRESARSAYEKTCEHRNKMKALILQREAEAEQRKQDARVRAEREKRDELLRLARDLRRANDIRALVDQVVRSRGADPEQQSEVDRWAEWARQVADRTDPIRRMSFDRFR